MTGRVIRRSIWGLAGSLSIRSTTARPVLWDGISYFSSRSSSERPSSEKLQIERRVGSVQRRAGSGSNSVNVASIVIPVVAVSLFAIIILVVQVQRRPKWNAYVRQLFSGRTLAPVTTDGSATPMTTTATSRQAEGVTSSSERRVMTQAEINMRDARRNLEAERERRRTHGSLRSVRTLPRYREDLDESEMALMKGEAADEEDITAIDTFRRLSTDSIRSDPNESPNSNQIALPAEHSTGDLMVGRNRGLSVSTVLTTTSMASDDSRPDSQVGGATSTQRLILTNGWGEAPLYTEQGVSPPALPSADPSAPAHSGTIELLSTNATENTASSDQSRRRSGYRSFFSRASVGRAARQTGDRQTLSVEDARMDTGTSETRDDTQLDRQQNRQPYQQHRNRNSTSSIDAGGGLGNSFRSSNVSLLLHPTTSRSSVDARARLTSPSTLSISAPLPESVVRGSVYEVPKSGLTKDQMKFISSTENLNKYAIPFGESASRVSLDRRRSMEPDVPPPAFDHTSERPPTSEIDGLDPPPVLSSSSSASVSPDLSLSSELLETSSASSQVQAESIFPSSNLDTSPPKEHPTSSNSDVHPEESVGPSFSTTTVSTERLPDDFLGVELSFSSLPSLELSPTTAPAPAPASTLPASPISSPSTTTPTSSSARDQDKNTLGLKPTPVSIEVVPPTPISVLGPSRSFA